MCITRRRRCVQVIPVKGMSLVSRSAGPAGEAFAACGGGEGGIAHLAPLPYAQQAAALADRNELAAALEMAALIPSSQARLLVSACHWHVPMTGPQAAVKCLNCWSTLGLVLVGYLKHQHGVRLSQQLGNVGGG